MSNIGTYNSTCATEIKQKLPKEFLIDPQTGRAYRNPEWNEDIHRPLKKALAPCKKKWQVTETSLNRLLRANRQKKVDLLFTSKLLPEDFFNKLKELKNSKKGKSIAFRIIKYFHYAVYVLKMTSLHQTQGYIAKKLRCTREWINKKMEELCQDGLINSLYRHLCSCLYSMNHLFFDMFYRHQLNEIFGYIFYSYNRDSQEKFTQQISIYYKSLFIFNSLSIEKENLALKGEIPSKFSSIIDNLRKTMTKKMPVLCL